MSGSEPMRVARRQIAEALAAGVPFTDVEAGIERRALSRDARDALWLYAWSCVERRQLDRWALAWRQ